jgi:hypothetical protein
MKSSFAHRLISCLAVTAVVGLLSFGSGLVAFSAGSTNCNFATENGPKCSKTHPSQVCAVQATQCTDGDTLLECEDGTGDTYDCTIHAGCSGTLTWPTTNDNC